jgi:hypothetical protein
VAITANFTVEPSDDHQPEAVARTLDDLLTPSTSRGA